MVLVTKVKSLSDRFLLFAEKGLPWLSLVFFVLGVLGARQSRSFALFVSGGVEQFISAYGYIAPVVIFLILTPTLLKLFLIKGEARSSVATLTIRWFVGARILACLYAVVATALLFGMPFYEGGANLAQAVKESLVSIAWMLTHSVYFYAVYASIACFAVLLRFRQAAAFVSQGVDLVEYLGRFLIPFVPLFMMGIGAYLTLLPEELRGELVDGQQSSPLGTVSFAGYAIDSSTPWGMITLYVLTSLATGMICGLWHLVLLFDAKRKLPTFSIVEYFSKYWIKIYPLLWSTSSEALATPLNLYLVRNVFPQLREDVRQFVVGTGSILNINGTMMNVFIMTGLVVSILGLEISFFQLLLTVPIVIVIGYGVPGIPGELVLFGGPIALCLGIAPELTPVFLGLYIGLQIGLPDSFRTAANSTDECLAAVILNARVENCEFRERQRVGA